MPRAALPPTPASSTDLTGQDGTKQLPQLQMAFELPPPAIKSRPATSEDTGKVNVPRSPESRVSPKTPYPIQPSEAVKSRRRSTAATTANKANSFALPPPPTRSRKIIQMKPWPQDDKRPADRPAGGRGPAGSTKRGAAAAAAAAAATPTTANAAAPGPARKKQQQQQPSTTSSAAAGRKVARKTAHSLIERRRRSKMNEEFSVLKDMIPACTGEMHKLAILQASIDYVRYLHDCIEKLKAQQRDDEPRSSSPAEMSGMPAQPSGRGPYDPEEQQQQQHPPPDVEMTSPEATPSPTYTTHPSAYTTAYHQEETPIASPALAARNPAPRHEPYPSSSSSSSSSSVPTAAATAAAEQHHRHCSYSSSRSTATASSPAFVPQAGGYGYGYGAGAGGYAYAPSSCDNSASGGSALTSPALDPLRERCLDQEAMAALLMLNADRRGTVPSDDTHM
ncbi:hypothetical protein VPNG_09036 [Cytospora leucostoma]|uniref:BHLH domain-containing protein n=1 Tax=Cytospora leucostoma TaxID=1230097 RepID=A0A423VZ89_9PEZI|nr:hypothetical protein VPNG_09036 [Cytospora leucostoma]